MPYDSLTISTREAEQMMEKASALELYLIKTAFKGALSWARWADAPIHYYILDQYTSSLAMPAIVSRLNAELERLEFDENERVKGWSWLPDLVGNLRTILTHSKRAQILETLASNQEWWNQAEDKNVWVLSDTEFRDFCRNLKGNS